MKRRDALTVLRVPFLLSNIFRRVAAVPTPCEWRMTGLALSVMELETEFGTAEFWAKMGVIAFLVLLGGCFAGLTLGLMGLDETNLLVLMRSGEEHERKHAERVYALLGRGRHWVLVTLLLSNVIVNETLPIILDSVFGGGLVAVLASTVLIVIFGEIIPQAICVRHGLAIGAKFAYPMLVLMYIMYPVAYPTALLLDRWLGESHGTVYRKAELKTLVSLHQGETASDLDALTEDEVTIIGAVLDLRDKDVSHIMTPIEDVYTLSLDAVLDEKLVNTILSAGYSRIPIHTSDDKSNFVGMLLVKQLITYDPEDNYPVKDFPLSTLPETGIDTSCLDILNFFQEGRSHMALVSENPGGEGGALGVITLEDVIEELIGEEIVDETDVYVDVHNKIKVMRRPINRQKIHPSLAGLLHTRRLSGSTISRSSRANRVPTKVSLAVRKPSHQDGSELQQPNMKDYGALGLHGMDRGADGDANGPASTEGVSSEQQPLLK
ncbi:Protein MAM3 [Bifiguratus adelaidae]|uniref:Protein MAM3 n=1 Tax=Bifiguratus adelaidae TaxID=1938954 RepID=A0A261Y176_9FUNG|nr:Protein MAM3 [Bifiguratus adelaidae]